jgi:hypothetical protein
MRTKGEEKKKRKSKKFTGSLVGDYYTPCFEWTIVWTGKIPVIIGRIFCCLICMMFYALSLSLFFLVRFLYIKL